ncbi:MAG TPA: YciI family protein [Ilumatobacteraceae bacterium]|nr:YciI family protein [Ilumatobacteraceae bacterium]
MQYMLLIYDNEAEMVANRKGATDVMMAEYREFTDSILKSGNMKAGDALQPTSTATCVRIRNGKTLTTDGPFAETKEQLGGYYLIEAKDLNDALQVASKIPSAKLGTVEVRPIQEFN